MQRSAESGLVAASFIRPAVCSRLLSDFLPIYKAVQFPVLRALSSLPLA